MIITSSRGGAASVVNDNTIFSIPKANTFTLIYNDKYQSKLIDKPFTGNPYPGDFVRFYSPDGAAESAQAASAIRAELRFSDSLKSSRLNPLNFYGGDFTIELKLRKNLNTIGTFNPGTNRNTYMYQWPMFFGRKTYRNGRSAGWGISVEKNTWRFNLWKGGNTNVNFCENSDIEIPDGNGHTLAVSVKTEGSKRFFQLYTDGKFVSGDKREIPEALLNSIDNFDAPITIGYIPDDVKDPFDGNVSDIKIWRIALPDDVVTRYACDTYVSTSHPFYRYLASYWPCREGAGGTFKNEILTEDGKYDFKVLKGGTPLVKGTELGDNTVWERSNFLVCPTSLTNLSAAVPNSRDIATQVISWLGIPIKESWNLEGRVFLNN